MKKLIVLGLSAFVLAGCGPKKQVVVTDSSYSSNVNPAMDVYLPSDYELLVRSDGVSKSSSVDMSAGSNFQQEIYLWGSKSAEGYHKSLISISEMKLFQPRRHWVPLSNGHYKCSVEERQIKGHLFEICAYFSEVDEVREGFEEAGVVFGDDAYCFRNILMQHLPLAERSRKLLVTYKKPGVCSSRIKDDEKEELIKEALQVLENPINNALS